MIDRNDPKKKDSIAHDNATRLFPAYLPWFVLIPASPFLFSIAALSFFIGSSPDTTDIFIKKLLTIDIAYVDEAVKDLTHISNLLNYFSITAVHAIVCLIVIGFSLQNP